MSKPSPRSPGTEALIYVRVSKQLDREKGHKVTTEMQLQLCEDVPELADLRVIRFEDIDKSGKETEHRPGYLAMLSQLRKGDAKYVVAYDLSRLTRHMGDLQALLDAMVTSGTKFVGAFTGEIIDPANEDHELRANILAAVNQHERQKTGSRLRSNLAARVKRGEMVGPVPAGYVRRKAVERGVVTRIWIEHEEPSATLVRSIFEEYGTGKYSFVSLARHLNKAGTALPRSAELHNNQPPAVLYTADVLKDLLSNPRYMGVVPRRDGERFKGAFEPIVSADLWQLCAQVRAANRQRHGVVTSSSSGKREWKSAYALTNLLRCSMCGGRMRGESKALTVRTRRGVSTHATVADTARVARCQPWRRSSSKGRWLLFSAHLRCPPASAMRSNAASSARARKGPISKWRYAIRRRAFRV